MATGTAGTNARRYHHCMLHYLRKAISYTDGAAATVTVGTVPAGALIHDVAVTVTQVFNWGAGNTLNIGTVADPDGFGTALLLTAKGKIVADEMATSDDLYATTDTVITATHVSSSTQANAGQGIIVVTFSIDNDG